MVQVKERKLVEEQVEQELQEQVQVESGAGRKEFREAPVTTLFKKFGNNKDVSLVFGELKSA